MSEEPSSSDVLFNSPQDPRVRRNQNANNQESEDLLATEIAEYDVNNPSDVVNNQSQEEEEELEELSVKEVINRLQTAWINEKFSPCLLTPQSQIVNCLVDQVKQMEANLNEIAKTDFRVPLHKMELSRIRFMITSYFRIRLKKIQTFIHTLDLQNEGQSSKMLSPEELKFAKKYKETLYQHFSTLAFRHMPGDFNKMPAVKKADPKLPGPNLDSIVFAKVLRNENGILIEDEAMQGRDEEIDVVVGNQLLIRYKIIKDLIDEGVVKLM